VAVEFKYTPLFNTFQEDAAESNQTLPYFYHTMNRTQDNLVPLTKATQRTFMLTQGATPSNFTKVRTIKYKPNWLQGGLTALGQNSGGTIIAAANIGAKCSYDWLPAPIMLQGSPGNNTTAETAILPIVGNNPSLNYLATNTVVYNGHADLCVQDSSYGLDTQQSLAKVECTVHWVFKGPCGSFPNLRDPEPVKVA
jgi:hypothetical protein